MLSKADAKAEGHAKVKLNIPLAVVTLRGARRIGIWRARNRLKTIHKMFSVGPGIGVRKKEVMVVF